MVKRNTLHCSVITPEKQVVDADVVSVVLPAHDGLIGVLNHRAPLLCEVGVGVLKLDGGEVGHREMFVAGGFAQVLDNEVTILTTQALDPDEIKRDEAAAAREAALKLKITDDASYDARQKAIARAETQLKMAK